MMIYSYNESYFVNYLTSGIQATQRRVYGLVPNNMMQRLPMYARFTVSC